MAETSTSWRMTRFLGKATEDQTPTESLFIPNTEPGAANRRTRFPGNLSKDAASLTTAGLNEPTKERQAGKLGGRGDTL